MTERGIPRQGMPIPPAGVVTSGTMSPSLGIGIGMGYVPAASAMPGTAIEIDVRGRRLAAEVARKPLYVKETHMTDASYPDGLRYNEEHDWVRVDGDIATFGITWYAQDSSARSCTSARRGRRAVAKDGEYGELESTKAVSTLIAPLSGEVTETNDALEGNESTVNDDPYGAGWLIKVRLATPRSSTR